MVACLLKMKHHFICVCTGEPDFSDLPPKDYDWSHAVCGKDREAVPKAVSPSLGKCVVTTTLEDTNLCHDYVMGRSVTSILHIVNQTPVEWCAKKQVTVEVATCRSEFVTARITSEQIIGLRTTLRCLGVAVHGLTWMFGDNGLVIASSTVPHSPHKKRHQALSHHFTREVITSDTLDHQHIPGEVNAADIVSKHWGYSQTWPMLKAILFLGGDTSVLLAKPLPGERKPKSKPGQKPGEQ
jgi:hypothetical protein